MICNFILTVPVKSTMMSITIRSKANLCWFTCSKSTFAVLIKPDPCFQIINRFQKIVVVFIRNVQDVCV